MPFLSVLLQASDWSMFLGRLHPLLVHLPIGFLVLAALLEVGQRAGWLSVSESVKSFVLLCAAIGATLSCVAGFLLASGGGYEDGLLGQHQWQGIGVAVFAWVAWLVSNVLSRRLSVLSAAYYPAFAASVVFMFLAGHAGGSLTHGEDYLTQYTPEPFRSLAGMPAADTAANAGPRTFANVNEALVYEDIVQPLLASKCSQCHGTSKQKGKLRLDSFEHMQKGGENGPVVVAGKGAESGLVKACLLPLEDEMHMPPKGKPQLTESQISLISWWIDQGIPRNRRVAELQQTEAVKAGLLELGSPGAGTGAAGGAVSSGIAKLQVAEGDAGTIAELKKLNLLVSPVARDKNTLEVSAVNAPDFSDAQTALLGKLAEQIVWLKLGRTKVTDAGAAALAGLKNLNKLSLEYTPVTDALLEPLAGLGKLEYLNLIGTKVSDEGMTRLAKIKSLKHVFLWQSAVTDSGMATLRRLRPDLEVTGGISAEEVSAFLNAAKKDSLDPKTKAAASK